MMASPSKELEDYWNEFKTIEQASIHNDDEELSKTPDDGEMEAAWLGAAGFQSLVTKFQDGKDLSDDELETLTDTLTQAQAETVRRRVNALSTTMRKKNKGSKLHVKDIFPNSDDPTKVSQDEADSNHQTCPVSQSQKTEGTQDIDKSFQTLSLNSLQESWNNSFSQSANISLTSDMNISLDFHLQEVFEPKFDPLGVTLVGDLAECDLEKIRALAHIELTTMFDHYNIVYSRPKRKRRVREHGIFGVPLEVLVEQDQKRSPGTTIPIVFQAMVNYLEKEGLQAEGILRVSRAETRTKQLRQDIEEKFYQGLFAWGDAGPHDVAVVFKQFLRELPIPLLSYDYLDAFPQIIKIPKTAEQLKALNLLVLLLIKEHRNTLQVLLCFLRDVISNSDQNKMSLNNVAMIMAPNLFLAPRRNHKEKADLDMELKKAAGTSNIVKMLIHFQDVLWTVPPAFISQIRRQYTYDAHKKSKVPKLPWKKEKERPEIYKKLVPNFNQPEGQDGVIRVQAPHLNKSAVLIHLDQQLTADDVVARVKFGDDQQRILGNEKLENNNGHTFRSANNAQHDYLHEVGGNIGERCLDPSTKVMEVYHINPQAEWVIKPRVRRLEAWFPVPH